MEKHSLCKLRNELNYDFKRFFEDVNSHPISNEYSVELKHKELGIFNTLFIDNKNGKELTKESTFDISLLGYDVDIMTIKSAAEILHDLLGIDDCGKNKLVEVDLQEHGVLNNELRRWTCNWWTEKVIVTLNYKENISLVIKNFNLILEI